MVRPPAPAARLTAPIPTATVKVPAPETNEFIVGPAKNVEIDLTYGV